MALVLKAVTPRQGSNWVREGFRLYGRAPLGFTSLFGSYLFIAMLVAQVPVLGAVLQLVSLPLLSLGIMVAGQAVLLGDKPKLHHFIEPLKTSPLRRRGLMTLCGAYGLIALLVLVGADVLSDHAWERIQKVLMEQGAGAQAAVDEILTEPGVSRAALLLLIGGVSLSVPFWHAPALVHWGGMGVRQALFSSTVAVWRAKGAFLLFTFTWLGVLLAFGLVAALTAGLLGFPQLASLLGVPAGLVFSAAFYVSVLYTFTDSFGGTPALPELDTPLS